MAAKWLYKKGELTSPGWELHLDATASPLPEIKHVGIRVGTVTPDQNLTIAADSQERTVFVLAGGDIKVSVTSNDRTEFFTLRGRATVFSGPTDHLYIPINSAIEVSGAARIAIGEAPAKNVKPISLLKREDVPVFIRGAGRESRQVHNFGMPDNLDADRFIVVEVIVPAGNWSGAPAHKHDTYVAGKESNLEEIYYFESALERGRTATGAVDPVGYVRGYASDHREFDITAEVRSGDLLLVPHGWHGPVAAAPGYDLYFFNVMAGPDPVREWNVTDDPHHAWIRESWKDQAPDPRLPYTSEK
jgi:5-deoxy-glucuronate isomerase